VSAAYTAPGRIPVINKAIARRIDKNCFILFFIAFLFLSFDKLVGSKSKPGSFFGIKRAPVSTDAFSSIF